jgi:glycosyltransferase involved in cell wall biosynthesis
LAAHFNNGIAEQGPLVSVIMPCYNQGRYLAFAIGSLQTQSLASWECLIINDGSDDDTEKVSSRLSSAEPRVRCLQQNNRGPSAARNLGLAQARGHYIQFLDADDLLERRKLELHVAHLEASKEDGIVYGDLRYFADEDSTQRSFGLRSEQSAWVAEFGMSGQPMLNELLSRNVMAVNCPILRRSVVERIGPFDEAIPGCEDWEYWIRCAAAGERFYYLEAPETLALVRSHPQSTSRDRSRMHDGECRFRVKLGGLLRGNAKLRLDNFEKAANRLGELNPPDYVSRLLQLAKANVTPRVYAYTLLRLIDRQNRLRDVARALRSAVAE